MASLKLSPLVLQSHAGRTAWSGAMRGVVAWFVLALRLLLQRLQGLSVKAVGRLNLRILCSFGALL